MDIQAYIESGIIESYVLGMASDVEAAELIQLCKQYPAIQKALIDFEIAFEAQTMNATVEVPAGNQDKIKTALLNEGLFNAPIVEMQKHNLYVGFSKYVAAASIILLVISGGLNIYFYNKFKETAGQYQAMLLEKNSLQANNQLIQTKALDLYNSMQMMTDPAMKKVSMPGVAGKEKSLATVFWDTKSKDVYVLPNKLPQAKPGMQYQLWAIVDGKPVDAGMIGDCAGLCKMKNIPQASMFAITLEHEGGSAQPDMSEMYVAGKVG